MPDLPAFRSPWDRRVVGRPWRFALGALVGLGGVAAITFALPETVTPVTIASGLLLLTVVLAMIVGDAVAAVVVLAAALTSFLYFFESPHESFTRRSFTDWAALGTIAAVGVVLLAATAILRRNARLARAERARLNVLLRVSSHFDANLDPDAALQQIAAAVVPEFADHCVLDLLTHDGTFRRIVAADLDPSTTSFAVHLERYAPSPERIEHPSWRVVRGGEPVLINGVDDKARVANAESGEHLEITRMLDRQSLMVVPIVADGRAMGALTLAQRKVSHRRFTRRDVPVARELGVRAGSALQNAFTHGRLRDAFVDVQRALLPRRIPLLPGVRLGTRYVPAGAASEVGGDWYAIVPMGGERIGLAVGDAVGSGPRATAAMARARFALLALAHQGAEPATVLTELNELLLAIRAEDVLTVVYGILDVVNRRWTEARAGHLPTILAAPDGTTRLLDTKPGVPLTVVADTKYEQHEHELGVGTRVVLYTDGLVERRGEVLDTGIERLRARVAEGDEDLDAAGAAITEALVGDVPEDDVALLIAELGSPVG